MASTRLVRTALAFLVALAGGIALSSCSGGGPTAGLPECEDGIDNDNDLFIDELDPACKAGRDRESDDPTPKCEDGIDNDGDGHTDGDDPGCTYPGDDDEYDDGTPECGDGVDNDGDGKIDYPFDPGCRNRNQDSETDDCPSGPNCPQCGDGVDNDHDNRTDYPNDSGCTNAADDDEFVLDTSACGLGTAISILPQTTNPVMVMGMAGAGTSNVSSPTCHGSGQETVYVIQMDHAATMVATTDLAQTTYNTTLYLRTACRDDATELACNDDISATNTKSTLTADLTPGIYYLVVDARDLASSGNFGLKVQFYAPIGEDCAGPMDCAPGYVCRAVAPSTQTTCEHPVCSDGRDDDSDGHVDFPADPGCTALDDSDETDTCPTGPGCPACGDGVDNDVDGFTDYPTDIGCTSASDTTELDCLTETDPLVVVTGPTYTGGTTVGAHNDQRPTCGSTTNTAPDIVHLLNLRVPVQTLTVTITPSFDSAIAVMDSTCTTSLACADPNTLTMTAVQPGAYNIVVDGWGSGSGTYGLNIRGDLTAGGSCDDPLVAAGVLLCPSGYSCQGPSGSATCQPAACNDAIDADGDGFPGYPTDPGCATPSDNDESDDCPSGPMCPVCSNDLDDDSDGQIDYPVDVACSAASGTTEVACQAETDPVIVLTGPTFSGTTTGASNSLTPSCGSTSHTAPERVHLLNLPVAVASLQVTLTSTWDAATSLLDATCGTTVQCSDPNSFTRTNVPAGSYAISVDGWSAGNGAYTLNVRGNLNAGDRCDLAMATSGLLVCPTGYACGGTAGAEVCRPAACNDTVDADGDGFPSYPTDPGCASPSDDDEMDDCPTGPGCPVCANGQDDDTDGFIDYPADVGCGAASGISEIGCPQESDPVIVLTSSSFSGTTVGASNSLTPTCGSTTHTAGERVHLLNLPVPVASLAVNLTSSFDAATSLLDAACTTTLQCADPNSFTRTNVPAGAYEISVDGWSSGTGTYTLNVVGTLNANDRCVPSMVASGLLVCPTGYSCAGAAGTETCAPAACNDTVDADGDGFPGYPTDPGCTSPSDGDETDNCPSGPGCPVCGNGIDDDSDGLTDYPADFGCGAASGTNEVPCPIETDAIVQVVGPTTSGTTVGAADNFTPSCQTNDAADRVHILTLAVPVATLHLDTEMSALSDTVLAVTDATCGTQLACDDDSGTTPTFSSAINMTNVAAGSYGVVVDTYGTTTPATYFLHVSGTIAAGGSCNDPLVAAGVLTCATGTCTGGICQ